MKAKTVLCRLLEGVRTFDANLDACADTELAKILVSRDFYGSPLNDVELATPYPCLPTEPDARWDGSPLNEVEIEPPYQGFPTKPSLQRDRAREVYRPEPVRYPPHVPAEGLESFDILSTWPLPSLRDDEDLSVPAVVFLEVLRCIAAPATDTNVTRLESGLLSPRKLQRGYFTQVIRGINGPLVLQDNEPAGHGANADLPGGDHKQRRLFRETFLAVYAHVLLRHVAARSPSFVASVVNTLHDHKRGDLFRQSLTPAPTPEWQSAVNSAFHCVRRPTFRNLYLTPTHFLDGLAGLQALPANNMGNYTFAPADRAIRLPATLAAVLHLCIERTGLTASLYADNRGHMHAILDDAGRIDRADEILKPEHWIEFTFPANDPQHDLGPSIHLATWASLCAVLEALAAGILPLHLDVPAGAPSRGI